MEIVNRRQRMTSVLRKLRRAGDTTVGLIPTMGALHEGHLSLVREARRMCDVVIVSIFVNPTQFNEPSDFKEYPRRLTEDTALLTDYNVEYIFAPTPEEIYPPGFSTYVNVEGLTDSMEGAHRPGHFRGVATVVTVLLNVTRPDFAYFGQKDAQQTIVIKRLVRDLGLDTEIIVLPIIREPSGLAMSSRNSHLDASQRAAAATLYRALSAAEISYRAGERSARKLIEIVRAEIIKEPRFGLEYVQLTDAETLKPLDKLDARPALLALAARIGGTRLIDNVLLAPARTGNTGALPKIV